MQLVPPPCDAFRFDAVRKSQRRSAAKAQTLSLLHNRTSFERCSRPATRFGTLDDGPRARTGQRGTGLRVGSAWRLADVLTATAITVGSLLSPLRRRSLSRPQLAGAVAGAFERLGPPM
jgi:hypothetical protein